MQASLNLPAALASVSISEVRLTLIPLEAAEMMFAKPLANAQPLLDTQGQQDPSETGLANTPEDPVAAW